jgi:hypothetical protein
MHNVGRRRQPTRSTEIMHSQHGTVRSNMAPPRQNHESPNANIYSVYFSGGGLTIHIWCRQRFLALHGGGFVTPARGQTPPFASPSRCGCWKCDISRPRSARTRVRNGWLGLTSEFLAAHVTPTDRVLFTATRSRVADQLPVAPPDRHSVHTIRKLRAGVFQ